MTQKHDAAQTLAWADVAAAIGLLSRLPVPVDADRATARGAKAAWAYPLAGLAVAVIAAGLAQITLWMGLPAPLAAGVAIGGLVIVTGALHEDGLADSADGLWGGWTKVRRLEIMKDSRIGAYGVIALVISLGLRWQALALLIAAGALWPAMIGVAMISRAVMVPVMTLLPNARSSGLSQRVGRPGAPTSWVALAVALTGAVVAFLGAGLGVMAMALMAAALCALIAASKIGGQTGDILGAVQQISEITMLLTLAALLA